MRLVALLIICWALVGQPSLCVGGVILHACDCAEVECTHEEQCDDDPCVESVFPRPEQRSELTPDSDLAVLPPVQVTLSALPHLAWRGAPIPWVRNIPRPSSDLPLLL